MKIKEIIKKKIKMLEKEKDNIIWYLEKNLDDYEKDFMENNYMKVLAQINLLEDIIKESEENRNDK